VALGSELYNTELVTIAYRRQRRSQIGRVSTSAVLRHAPKKEDANVLGSMISKSKLFVDLFGELVRLQNSGEIFADFFLATFRPNCALIA
jgi:hypothetical protein